MANDFMTMTPGSEVGDALQEILVRRRQAKQQDFLNSLQTKTQADNEAYRNMQAQSLADERQAHEAQMQSEDWNRRAQLHGGEAAANLSPEDLQYGLQHGWLSQDHVAALTGGDATSGAQPSGAPTASEPTYHWGDTDKSRAAGVKASQSKALQALMDSPAFQALPPLNQLAIRAKIVGGEVPGGADFTEAPKPTSVQRYGMNRLNGNVSPLMSGGKPVMGPENSPIVEWGEQPNSGDASADAPKLFQIDDPSGEKDANGQTKQISILAKPSALLGSQPGHIGSTPGVRVFGGNVRGGNEPNPPARKPIAAGSTGAFQKLTSLLAAGNDPMDAGVKAARAQAISSLVDPTFKQDVSHFVQRSESGVQVTPDYVHSVLHAPDGVDPQQYENAVTTLLHASGIF